MTEPNLELVAFIQQQGQSPVGIPVLLFTDATLAAADGAESATVADQAAADLGFDLDRVELFSTEAYLVQTVAGRLTAGT